MSAVLVSHPHVAAFSVGVAASLARVGNLAAYVTGVAFDESKPRSKRVAEILTKRWPVVRNRIVPGLPPDALRALSLVEIGARTTAGILRMLRIPLNRYDTVFAAHDAAVSLMPWPRRTDVVYAYEDAALWTFRKASRRNIARVWDLPLPHYLTIESLWRQEVERWPDAIDASPPVEPNWKKRRKDAELALATRVVVASRFTKQSLEPLKVEAPVHVVPYGFPVEAFTSRAARPSGRFTVLSVGTHDLRKGTPYLLEAWKQAAIPDAELHLIGPLRLSKSFLDRYAGHFRHFSHVAKTDLGTYYAGADLLAFPTLGDGFGLVMQEAMCCGTPVVTTTCGGGPECITDGVDGWLVPPRDIDALVERFRRAAKDRDATFATGLAARARAERWTWEDAGSQLVRHLRV